MSYRPEGWETLKAKNHPLHCLFPDECVGQSYEAGADAMLKALRGQGGKLYERGEFGDRLVIPVGLGGVLKGILVFIPDD